MCEQEEKQKGGKCVEKPHPLSGNDTAKEPEGQPSEDEICAPCVAWKTKTHFWQIKLKCATFWMEWKMPSEMS